ncbi:DUF6350 family protein [Microbacterium sp. SYP-A9085]|uniref:cell division protein PerM n=1 Tax=Microbacterium sp. SYP-A9085 TaxID=2664454 RepID=UPI001C12BA43|nr:DUF6350 family protein [Microbacterium sp. SYP-A9085]
MHRVLVAVLAAFDAAVTAAVGLVVVLAPLTLLWVAGMSSPHWVGLWPATAAIWQLGHLVPVVLHLPVEYLAAAGIPEGAASFTLSLAPLALAGLTALFAARSGARAGRSGRGTVGVIAGTVVFAAVAVIVAATARTPIAVTALWQAVLLPVAVFAIPAAAAAIAVSWRDAAGRAVRLRALLLDLPGMWPEAPALVLRGAAAALTALCGAGALAITVALLARGDEVVALYQAGNLDAAGVIVVSLAQLAFLPTLVVWAVSFLAGPGFAVGLDTAVSPAGTQLGIVPGIPILGGLPESVSPLLLGVVLLPIAAGGVAGWVLRDRVRALTTAPEYGLRVVLAVGVAAVTGGGAALMAWLASGSIGPGRLAHVGPQPGAVALAVGVEVLIGAAVLLLGPDVADRPRHGVAADAPGRAASSAWDPDRGWTGDASLPREAPAAPHQGAAPPDADATETQPIDPGFLRERGD